MNKNMKYVGNRIRTLAGKQTVSCFNHEVYKSLNKLFSFYLSKRVTVMDQTRFNTRVRLIIEDQMIAQFPSVREK